MRRMIVEVSPTLLAQFMKDGTGIVQVFANPLPADARIVDARLSFGGTNLQLVVESETFEELQEGEAIPLLKSPQFKRTEPIETVSRRFGIPVKKLREDAAKKGKQRAAT